MSITCYGKATEWVHLYALGGGALAVIPNPIPFGTTASLVAAETHMVYWIARIYGEDLSMKEIGLVLGGIGLAGEGLRTVALEAANWVPVIGWLVKPVIAAGAIEGIGHVIARHYEQKYPGKFYSVDPDVERASKRK